MRHASEASIFKQKQIILRAKRASPPQELSKFGAKRQFFASIYEYQQYPISFKENYAYFTLSDYILSYMISLTLILYLEIITSLDRTYFRPYTVRDNLVQNLYYTVKHNLAQNIHRLMQPCPEPKQYHIAQFRIWDNHVQNFQSLK